MIATLIVDDERLARKRIARLLTNYPELHLIGECASGVSAIEAIQMLRPELIFLDIHLKDMSGFEVLENVNLSHNPLIIFVTAYDQYALRAFDYFAFDYLLKPYKDVRFDLSVKKALEHIYNNQQAEEKKRLQSLLHLLKEEKKISPRNNSQRNLPIKLAGKIYFIEIDDIQYIEASGCYIEIFTTEKKHLLRETLTKMLTKLEEENFIRIHRSTIINTVFLEEINRIGLGDVEVVMKDGKVFKVSKSHKELLFERLGIV